MSTYIVTWPQEFQPWHRAGSRLPEPYGAVSGTTWGQWLVSIPPRPYVTGVTTYVLGTLTSLRPTPRAG